MINIKALGKISDTAISKANWDYNGCEINLNIMDINPKFRNIIISDIKNKYNKGTENITDILFVVIPDVKNRTVKTFLYVYVDFNNDNYNEVLNYYIYMTNNEIRAFAKKVLLPFFKTFTFDYREYWMKYEL